MKTETKALVPIKTRITKMQSVVEALIVDSAESLKSAVNIRANIKDVAKQIKIHKDARIKPINASLKLIRADYAPLEKYCEIAENVINKKIITYQNILSAEQEEKERKLAARVEKGTLKIETAARKLEETKIQKNVVADKGAIVFKKVKMFKVVDLSKLPQKYLLSNDTLIRKVMYQGILLPGVTYWEEDNVSSR